MLHTICTGGLQEYAKTQDHLTHFLTYADNNAVGYFAKQGFTKEITLDKEYVSPPHRMRPIPMLQNFKVAGRALNSVCFSPIGLLLSKDHIAAMHI